MAEIKIEQGETQGIKLFGKTILLDVKVEDDATKPANHDDDNNNNDNDKTATNNNNTSSSSGCEESSSEMKRPDKIIGCPRCKSMDTKFCYFNNYNVNQPRHFCKGCQRYWTAGGALRNVPVGAGRRRAKPAPAHPSPLPSPDELNSFFDAGVAAVHVDGTAVFQEYWAHHHQRQRFLATGRAGFQPDFPAKRRRINMNEPAAWSN